MNIKEQIRRGIEEVENAYRRSNRLLCKSEWRRRRYRVLPNAVPKGSRTYVSPAKYTHSCDLYSIDDCVRIRHRWKSQESGVRIKQQHAEQTLKEAA